MYLGGNNVLWLEGIWVSTEIPFPAHLVSFGCLSLITVLLPESTSSDWLFSQGQTGDVNRSPREVICINILGKRV